MSRLPEAIKNLFGPEVPYNKYQKAIFYDQSSKNIVCDINNELFYWDVDEDDITFSDWEPMTKDCENINKIDLAPNHIFKTVACLWDYYIILPDSLLLFFDEDKHYDSLLTTLYNPRDGLVYEVSKDKMTGLSVNLKVRLTDNIPKELRSIYLYS